MYSISNGESPQKEFVVGDTITVATEWFITELIRGATNAYMWFDNARVNSIK
jgi:hypothetical protein